MVGFQHHEIEKRRDGDSQLETGIDAHRVPGPGGTSSTEPTADRQARKEGGQGRPGRMRGIAEEQAELLHPQNLIDQGGETGEEYKKVNNHDWESNASNDSHGNLFCKSEMLMTIRSDLQVHESGETAKPYATYPWRAITISSPRPMSGVSSWISRLGRWRFMFVSAFMRRAKSVSEHRCGFADEESDRNDRRFMIAAKLMEMRGGEDQKVRSAPSSLRYPSPQGFPSSPLAIRRRLRLSVVASGYPSSPPAIRRRLRLCRDKLPG